MTPATVESPARSPAIDALLRGAVDLHFHSAPSPFPRLMDIAEAAGQYDAAGFRAVVLKSHHHSTAMDVLALKRPVLDAFAVHMLGSVALNGAVGGLNPRAVDLALRMGAKAVWFPTIGSSRHVAFHERAVTSGFPQAEVALMPEAPIDVVDASGDLLPATLEIIRLAHEARALLATGHMHPVQVEAVARAALAQGHAQTVVTHPDFIVELPLDRVVELADLGATIELALVMYGDAPTAIWGVDVLAERIATIGPDRLVLVSDLGQRGNPAPVAWFQTICSQLMDMGVRQPDLRRMVADNPARLLGLDP